MKTLLWILFLGFSLVYSGNLSGQEQTEEELDPLRFYKAKYDTTFKAPLEIVRQAVKGAIDSLPCVIVQDVMKPDEDGWLKVIIKSDYCVFVEGDSTFEKLGLFSYEMPFIRGGYWKNGRMQYKFIIVEQPDGETVNLNLKGSLSGYENSVTNKVHFWVSNGIFEHDILEKIKLNVDGLLKE